MGKDNISTVVDRYPAKRRSGLDRTDATSPFLACCSLSESSSPCLRMTLEFWKRLEDNGLKRHKLHLGTIR